MPGHPNFVYREGNKLFLNAEEVRFASYNAPEYLDRIDKFERIDTLKTVTMDGASGGVVKVLRTYTLQIKSVNIPVGHINGWNPTEKDWIWDEKRLVELDVALADARNAGVRLIWPIINQDYGNKPGEPEDKDNFVGNFSNLTRMMFGVNYKTTHQDAYNFFTRRELIDGYKKIIHKLLTRVNTVNSIVYGLDYTIFAWETGNEMNNGYAGGRASAHPPGAWTVEIADYIKSLAPYSLVMDGTFSRKGAWDSFAPEALADGNVDIHSNHFYGTWDVKEFCEVVMRGKKPKPFIAGEYGFFKTPDDFNAFLQLAKDQGVTGTLVWSLRPHAAVGGFKTHSEGKDGIYSYHVPGWKGTATKGFDPREYAIVRHIRDASYALSGQRVPKFPTPGPPSDLHLSHEGDMLRFRGATWAETYTLSVYKAGDRVGGGAVPLQTLTKLYDSSSGDPDLGQRPGVNLGLIESSFKAQDLQLVLTSVGVDGGGESAAIILSAAHGGASQPVTPAPGEAHPSVRYFMPSGAPGSPALPYAVYTPYSSPPAASVRFPAIIHLHGSGSIPRGGPPSLGDVKSRAFWDGVGKLVGEFVANPSGAQAAVKAVGERYLVILPVCPEPADWSQRRWKRDDVLAVVKAVEASFPVDRKRVVITGYSMGGKGALATAIQKPDAFHAVISSAGFDEYDSSGPLANIKALVDAQLDVALLWGTADQQQGPSHANGLKSALRGFGTGASGSALFTKAYDGADHSAMATRGFRDTAVWEWLKGALQ